MFRAISRVDIYKTTSNRDALTLKIDSASRFRPTTRLCLLLEKPTRESFAANNQVARRVFARRMRKTQITLPVRERERERERKREREFVVHWKIVNDVVRRRCGYSNWNLV